MLPNISSWVYLVTKSRLDVEAVISLPFESYCVWVVRGTVPSSGLIVLFMMLPKESRS